MSLSNRNLLAKVGSLWPWLIPLIAILVSAALLVREYRSRGRIVTLLTNTNPGMRADLSELRYRGVRCGAVNEVRIDPDLDRVIIRVRMEQWANSLAREGSQFWVVEPELKVGRVRGLDALRSGAYLTVAPGDGRPASEFKLLAEPPTVPIGDAGHAYEVYARRTHGIQNGAPVRYRGAHIGTVAEVELGGNASSVRFELFVRFPYTKLLRQETVFWPVSGLRADIGFFGADIEVGTLGTFWSGGIELATPPGSTPIEKTTIYWLTPEPKEEWHEWKPDLTL